MALLREFCVDGLILDYQNPSSDQDPSKAAIASAFPLVIQAAAAHNLSWAVMYDTSSKGADWGRNDPSVVQDWTEIMQLAADFRNQTLRDSAGNSMFFAFGPTPMPAADARCEKCAFYSQDGRDQGRSTAPGEHGAFAWIEPKAPSSYLPGFYEGGPGAHFPHTVLHFQKCSRPLTLSAGKCAKMYPDAPTPCVGIAYAGFKAVYPQYGSIARSPALLRSTLDLCARSADVCQIATWNDYNEGTHIQPSWWCDTAPKPESFLEVIRDFKLRQARAAAELMNPDG